MALLTIEEKDFRIQMLTKENEELRAGQKIKGTAEVTIIALEEQIYALRRDNEALLADKSGLSEKIRALVTELEAAGSAKVTAAADEALQEEILQLKRKIEEVEENLLVEKQRNM